MAIAGEKHFGFLLRDLGVRNFAIFLDICLIVTFLFFFLSWNVLEMFQGLGGFSNQDNRCLHCLQLLYLTVSGFLFVVNANGIVLHAA